MSDDILKLIAADPKLYRHFVSAYTHNMLSIDPENRLVLLQALDKLDDLILEKYLLAKALGE